MSYTRIVIFDEDGTAMPDGIEIPNSRCGALSIWSHIEKSYLEPYVPDGYASAEVYEKETGRAPSRLDEPFDHVLRSIWDEMSDPAVPRAERICLASTFEGALVERNDFEELIGAFRSFPAETTLGEQADVIEKLACDQRISAVAWDQTSIVDGFWIGEDDDGNATYYNYHAGDRHWLLFDEV